MLNRTRTEAPPPGAVAGINPPMRSWAYKPRTEKDLNERKPTYAVPFIKPDFQNLQYTPVRSKDKEEIINMVRVLPKTWDGEDNHYAMQLHIHNNIGLNGKGQYLCLLKMLGLPCPICAAIEASNAAGDADFGKKAYARLSWLLWIVDLKDPKAITPKWWKVTNDAETNIALAGKDFGGRIILIDDPMSGHDMSFSLLHDGKKMFNGKPVFEVKSCKANPQPTRVEQKFMDFAIMNPLTNILNFESAETLTKVIEGKIKPVEEHDEHQQEENQQVYYENSAHNKSAAPAINYENVMAMNLEELENVCLDTLKFPSEEVAKATEADLRQTIIYEMKLEPAKNPADARLARMQARR